MNKWITIVIALFSAMTFSACSATNDEVTPVIPTQKDKIKKFVGGDISMLPYYENIKANYLDHSGDRKSVV